MTNYIPADKLKAEIERRLAAYQKNFDKADNMIARLSTDGRIASLKALLPFVDSLQQEQPEVECEEEINKFFENVGMPVYWCNDAEQREFCSNLARHFYELGLNARKEK